MELKETEYHVVELSVVTDETIEEALNDWTNQGWIFDSIHFVNREASRRPSMAFIFFVREKKIPEEEKPVAPDDNT